MLAVFTGYKKNYIWSTRTTARIHSSRWAKFELNHPTRIRSYKRCNQIRPSVFASWSQQQYTVTREGIMRLSSLDWTGEISFTVSFLARKTTVDPLLCPPGGLIYFKHIWGGGLIETGDLFNLANTMVTNLHKELYTKWKSASIRSWRSRSRTSSWWINHPASVQTKFYGHDRLIQSIIY